MKLLARMTYFAGFLVAVATLTASDNRSQEQPSGPTAKVTLADGATQIARIDGIGCTESICSTVLMKAKSAGNTVVEVRFDSLAAIRDIRQNDALFVAKDHSERRLTFLSDFRVLYLARSGGARQKIDLAKIKSVEILDAGQ